MVARRTDGCPPHLRVKEPPRTLAATARKMGVSREWVRINEASALSKIRELMGQDDADRSSRQRAERLACESAARIIAKADGDGELVRAMVWEIRDLVLRAWKERKG